MSKYFSTPVIIGVLTIVVLVGNAALNFLKTGAMPDFTSIASTVAVAYNTMHNAVITAPAVAAASK